MPIEPQVNASTTDTSQVRVTFDASPVISLAMVHNRVQPVRNVELMNPGPGLTGAEVVLTVRDDEGVVSREAAEIVDLPHGATVHLKQLGLTMDSTAILDLEERRAGELSVALICDGRTVAVETRPVMILAGRQWLSRPAGLAMELLAAHVMPNSPVVETVLTEASALLKERTGSPSIEGYQAGEERVDLIAAAIFDAMRARQIRYANPPASWSDDGQKSARPTRCSTAGSARVWTPP
ncbi:hypothetical protein [Ornithinicoccus hortensis]|uniref:hypothetical protein n=1 Tax=Ornithinicoccus hortensis TaxID=82346 RepID=UPI0011535306|nr:hypothetical protein [Ornithinicoccus hortensis]